MKRAMVLATVVVLTLVTGTVASQKGRRGEVNPLPEIRLELLAPPAVPPPTGRSAPARVLIELTTTEQKGVLASGVEYTFWTFGGTVPGPFLRIREGDTVQITLANETAAHNAHSIDLHAVTGPGGGASVTQVMPGEASVFEWKAMNPGLYVYHC